MLRNVLGAYLERVTERELDLPFLLLLSAMGFHDVHFTHGAAEHGKDFVAKKVENGALVQYAFQTKVGDINLPTWRNNISNQVFSALTTGISHANFDPSLPRTVVLVTTGDLVGNAGNELQSFMADTVRQLPNRDMLFWGKQQLIERFEEYGLASAYRATATGLTDYGRFFLLYANAMRGRMLDRDIEEYSRWWSDDSLPLDIRLLLCALESEMVAEECISRGFHYEAIMVHLARLRTLCVLAYSEEASLVQPLYTEAVARLRDVCAAYLARMRDLWSEKRDLLTLLVTAPNVGQEAAPPLLTYPVQCARLLDVAALVYFTAEDDESRDDIASLVADFFAAEPGCYHPPGNRYTVGIVLSVLILLSRGYRDVALEVLRRVTIWLCDRYEQGVGLAGHEATAEVETMMLLGYPFDSVDVTGTRSSLLATALCDLAAYLGDAELYGDIVNDIKASHIYPEYWQPQDSTSVCSIESIEVLQIPHVEFNDTFTDFTCYQHGPHLSQEPDGFRVAEVFGANSLVVLMLLLRERYFPKMWLQFI